MPLMKTIYCSAYGIVHLQKEVLHKVDQIPTLFSSLSKAKRFCKTLQPSGAWLPIKLGMIGDSPREVREYHEEHGFQFGNFEDCL